LATFEWSSPPEGHRLGDGGRRGDPARSVEGGAILETIPWSPFKRTLTRYLASLREGRLGWRPPSESGRVSRTVVHQHPSAVYVSAGDPPKTELQTTPKPDPRDITQLLQEYGEGRVAAMDELMPLVYGDLKRIARNHLRTEAEGFTLHTTALVHESYVRLAGSDGVSARDRAHFFALASRVMRHVLVDHARGRAATKRGGGRMRVTLSSEAVSQAPRTLELFALHQALGRLGELDERLERVVECKVFGGMTTKETAEAVGVAVRTVEKDWTVAKAFLRRELGPAHPDE
jgi:RNA polymerase sigma-70 factor, ECF subfamily